MWGKSILNSRNRFFLFSFIQLLTTFFFYYFGLRPRLLNGIFGIFLTQITQEKFAALWFQKMIYLWAGQPPIILNYFSMIIFKTLILLSHFKTKKVFHKLLVSAYIFQDPCILICKECGGQTSGGFCFAWCGLLFYNTPLWCTLAPETRGGEKREIGHQLFKVCLPLVCILCMRAAIKASAGRLSFCYTNEYTHSKAQRVRRALSPTGFYYSLNVLLFYGSARNIL